MRKIINGKVYDTFTAEIVAGPRAEGKPGEDRFLRESLYMMPKSCRFFLYGSSGPWHLYSSYVGDNQYVAGSGVRPLTPKQALAWVQAYAMGRTNSWEEILSFEDTLPKIGGEQ